MTTAKRVLAAMAAVCLLLPATPALAAPLDAKSVSSSVRETANVKIVYNKAGSRELLKAASSLKSAFRAAQSGKMLENRLEAGLAAGTLTEAAAERLDARVRAAYAKALRAYDNGMSLAEAGRTLHQMREDEIYVSGGKAVPSRAYAAAEMAFERALEALESASEESLGNVFT